LRGGDPCTPPGSLARGGPPPHSARSRTRAILRGNPTRRGISIVAKTRPSVNAVNTRAAASTARPRRRPPLQLHVAARRRAVPDVAPLVRSPEHHANSGRASGTRVAPSTGSFRTGGRRRGADDLVDAPAHRHAVKGQAGLVGQVGLGRAAIPYPPHLPHQPYPPYLPSRSDRLRFDVDLQAAAQGVRHRARLLGVARQLREVRGRHALQAFRGHLQM